MLSLNASIMGPECSILPSISGLLIMVNFHCEIINFLDDDIIISHDYLKKTFSFFKENKKIDIVFGSIKIINKDKFYSR